MATEISLADKDVAVDPTQEQAHAEVINISSDQTDMLSQAYSQRISSVLQTTMDLDKLFSLFSQQIRPAIPHTGMVYTNLDHEISISVGGNEGVACVYSLVANEESIGELTLYREWAMTQREVTVFEYTLRGLIYPLRNALLYKQALHAAHKDPLTGTFNRATFEETVEREIGLAHRHSNALSLLVIDIDHFKQINDKLGHSAGDMALKCVAERTSACVRVTDIVFRYGGEEFVVLLSNTNTEGATLLAERIRESVSRIECQCSGNPTAISVSVGVATLKPSEDQIAFFERADKALYRAKHEGRNRVCTAD